MQMCCIATEKSLLTFASDINYISKGLAVTVEEFEGKPKIVIDLKNAKDQGADFKAALLKIARVIQ